MSCCTVAVEGTQSLPNLEVSGSKRQLCEGGLPIVRAAVRGFEGMEWGVHLWVISGLDPAPTSKNLLGRCPSRLLRRGRVWAPCLSTPKDPPLPNVYFRNSLFGDGSPSYQLEISGKMQQLPDCGLCFTSSANQFVNRPGRKTSLSLDQLFLGTLVFLKPKHHAYPQTTCPMLHTEFHLSEFPFSHLLKQLPPPSSEAGNEITRGKALWKKSHRVRPQGWAPVTVITKSRCLHSAPAGLGTLRQGMAVCPAPQPIRTESRWLSRLRVRSLISAQGQSGSWSQSGSWDGAPSQAGCGVCLQSTLSLCPSL